MVKNELYRKCVNTDFEDILLNKGYAYFKKGSYNLNIIGVRAKGRKVTNLYDDILVVIYNDESGKQVKKLYNITTEPGSYYMYKQLLNPKGTAILVPGQYRGCWKLGLHKGQYKALCQSKPIKVYRDNNRNAIYDLEPKTIEQGMFGINIHRSDKGITRTTIDRYSAGCQVFNNPQDFAEFIAICEKQKALYGNSFTYTLINEQDVE